MAGAGQGSKVSRPAGYHHRRDPGGAKGGEHGLCDGVHSYSVVNRSTWSRWRGLRARASGPVLNDSPGLAVWVSCRTARNDAVRRVNLRCAQVWQLDWLDAAGGDDEGIAVPLAHVGDDLVGPPRGRVQQRFQWRRAEEVLEAVDRVDSALTTASRYE